MCVQHHTCLLQFGGTWVCVGSWLAMKEHSSTVPVLKTGHPGVLCVSSSTFMDCECVVSVGYLSFLLTCVYCVLHACTVCAFPEESM